MATEALGETLWQSNIQHPSAYSIEYNYSLFRAAELEEERLLEYKGDVGRNNSIRIFFILFLLLVLQELWPITICIIDEHFFVVRFMFSIAFDCVLFSKIGGGVIALYRKIAEV